MKIIKRAWKSWHENDEKKSFLFRFGSTTDSDTVVETNKKKLI